MNLYSFLKGPYIFNLSLRVTLDICTESRMSFPLDGLGPPSSYDSGRDLPDLVTLLVSDTTLSRDPNLE